jgi:hypothetical protein
VQAASILRAALKRGGLLDLVPELQLRTESYAVLSQLLICDLSLHWDPTDTDAAPKSVVSEGEQTYYQLRRLYRQASQTQVLRRMHLDEYGQVASTLKIRCINKGRVRGAGMAGVSLVRSR